MNADSPCPGTSESLASQITKAIAEAGNFTYESLEPWDFQRETAAVLRVFAEHCDAAGADYTRRAHNEHASAAFAVMETCLRAADEAEYRGTPCDIVACDPRGEPCTTHERLMAHAEGEHELCDHNTPTGGTT